MEDGRRYVGRETMGLEDSDWEASGRVRLWGRVGRDSDERLQIEPREAGRQ